MTDGKTKIKWDNKFLAVIISLLAAFVVLAIYPVLKKYLAEWSGNFIYPYAKSVNHVKRATETTSLMRQNKRTLVTLITELEATNRRLAFQAATAAALLDENTRLRRQNRLQHTSPDWELINSEIISRDQMFSQEQFTVSGGTLHGVTEGAAVLDVTDDGRPVLVGVVRSVGKYSSQVITLSNLHLRLSCRVGDGNTTGLLNMTDSNHRREGILKVDLLRGDTRCVAGDVVYTTGYEPEVPGGILIGNLLGIDSRENVFSDDGAKSGSVRCHADLNRLRFVVIAVRRGGR